MSQCFGFRQCAEMQSPTNTCRSPSLLYQQLFTLICSFSWHVIGLGQCAVAGLLYARSSTKGILTSLSRKSLQHAKAVPVQHGVLHTLQ